MSILEAKIGSYSANGTTEDDPFKNLVIEVEIKNIKNSEGFVYPEVKTVFLTGLYPYYGNAEKVMSDIGSQRSDVTYADVAKFIFDNSAYALYQFRAEQITDDYLKFALKQWVNCKTAYDLLIYGNSFSNKIFKSLADFSVSKAIGTGGGNIAGDLAERLLDCINKWADVLLFKVADANTGFATAVRSKDAIESAGIGRTYIMNPTHPGANTKIVVKKRRYGRTYQRRF